MARRRADKANPRSVAQRNGQRDGKRRDKPKAAAANGPASEAHLKERLAALERECGELRAALELEQARCRALEEVHVATRDRIAWALTSLQNILDAKA